MNGFLLGTLSIAALGFVGNSLTTRKASKVHNLSNDTEILLEAVASSYNPPVSDGPTLPLKDVVSIYLNSRGNRDRVNECRLDNGSQECFILLQKMEEDHKLIKNLALACIGDRVLDRLVPNCHSTRHKRLLWTYADEQGVLGQIAEFCTPLDQNYISTRV